MMALTILIKKYIAKLLKGFAYFFIVILDINIPTINRIIPTINSIILNELSNAFIISNTILDKSIPRTKAYSLLSYFLNKKPINLIVRIIPVTMPNINGMIIFKFVKLLSIRLYVPTIISSAVELIPGTIVPKASSIPDINKIIVSK